MESPPANPAHVTGDRDPIARFWKEAALHLGLSRWEVVTGPRAEALLPPPAWSFGDYPAMADELLLLVLTGVKTATSSDLSEYQAGGEPLPEPGDLSILLDGSGQPRAVIRTTEVNVQPFDEVDADFAAEEGEGDRSLAYWRREHRKFFTRARGRDDDFDPRMPVVCERFELAWRPGGHRNRI